MAPPRSAVAAKLQKEQDDLLPSEDEEDEDFTLEDGEGDDGGSDSSDSERETGPATKRAKVDDLEPVTPALDKSAVDDLWASFNDSSADPYASTSSVAQTVQSTPASTAPTHDKNDKGKGKGKANLDQTDLVTIKVTYKFAGDTITQDKKVPRTSQEARDYFLLHPEALAAPPTDSTSPAAAAAAPTSASQQTSGPATSSLDALFGPDSTSKQTTESSEPSAPKSAAAPTTTTTAGGAKRKKAGGGGLGAMAAQLGVGSKPAKLNTLEKSKLDWNSYVQTQDGLEDTLQHARKDGYLEKKDFLDRVEMRKEEGWERGRKKGPR